MFDPIERDACNDPNIYLRERLLQLGYCLVTSDDNSLEDCTWVLFYDTNTAFLYNGLRGFARKLKAYLLGKRLFRELYFECVHAGLEKRTALFFWEDISASSSNWGPLKKPKNM